MALPLLLAAAALPSVLYRSRLCRGSGRVWRRRNRNRCATQAAARREVCRRAGVPTAEFAVRSDMPCGSTIGPILSSSLGVRTVDVGAPQLSMHSIREVRCVRCACLVVLHKQGVLLAARPEGLAMGWCSLLMLLVGLQVRAMRTGTYIC